MLSLANCRAQRQIGQFDVYFNLRDSSITAICHTNYCYKIINAGINNIIHIDSQSFSLNRYYCSPIALNCPWIFKIRYLYKITTSLRLIKDGDQWKVGDLSFLVNIHYFVYKYFILKMFQYCSTLDPWGMLLLFSHFFVTIFPDELCIFSRKISQKFTSIELQ